MKIALSGYGKMGKEVEKAALKRGHTIVCIADKPEDWDKMQPMLSQCDVVIDFSLPSSAPEVINTCFNQNIPVVSGTTGWEDELKKAQIRCREENKSFFYAPNFSIGVNIFFEINRKLASMMEGHNDYIPHIHEIHHIHKLDAPSGTAIALAAGVADNHTGYDKGWTMNENKNNGELSISSERTGEVPGTHTVAWSSETDTLEITHTAHSRQGFALGAVIAAEWIIGRTGFFGMKDLLKTGN